MALDQTSLERPMAGSIGDVRQPTSLSVIRGGQPQLVRDALSDLPRRERAVGILEDPIGCLRALAVFPCPRLGADRLHLFWVPVGLKGANGGSQRYGSFQHLPLTVLNLDLFVDDGGDPHDWLNLEINNLQIAHEAGVFVFKLGGSDLSGHAATFAQHTLTAGMPKWLTER